jgi:hypothetical protein
MLVGCSKSPLTACNVWHRSGTFQSSGESERCIVCDTKRVFLLGKPQPRSMRYRERASHVTSSTKLPGSPAFTASFPLHATSSRVPKVVAPCIWPQSHMSVYSR